MSTLIAALNNFIFRIVAGIIVSGTIASPYINDVSDSAAWPIAGALFLALVIATVVKKITFTDKHVPLFWALSISFILLAIYLGFQWSASH